MSSNDETPEKNKTAEDILKMLREAGVSTESLVEKSHSFWDTQVIFNCFNIVLSCISVNMPSIQMSSSAIHPNFAIPFQLKHLC